jgi:ribosomal-protein-alanine N-acetyltransferase
MWEIGSVANNRDDELSDLDVVFIVDDSEVGNTFFLIEGILNSLSKINHKWKVPEPTWHGHSQTFYKLKDCLDCFFVDAVVMKESSKDRFMEIERHGELSVKFDHKGYVSQSHVDKDIWRKEGRILNGMINFTTFERGPFQNCRLGYKIGAAYEGEGYMTETLQAAIRYVFKELNFHRVEANYIPKNERSGRLLKRLGFAEHGVAKNYLRIAGKWQNHILTSLTHDDWKEV